MSYSSDPTLIEDPDNPAPQGAFPVWRKVFTKPGEATFLEITEHPDATANSAYIWMFIAGTLSGLISSLTQFTVTLLTLRQLAPELVEMSGSPGMYGLGGLLIAICSAPITGIVTVIFFALSVAIVHAAARLLGGQGSFDRLAYAFAAIGAPATLISALLVPVNAIPFVAFCSLPLLLALGIYVLYLDVAAIKAVHRFGWGDAAAAFFLPTLLLGVLCGCLVLLLVRMAGPSINEIFQQLQQLPLLQ